MSKYRIGRQPKSDMWGSDPMLPPLQVPEAITVDTGLLNRNGNKIFREPNPMGFGHHNEPTP